MDKRIIEETPSTEVLNDDWFIKDSPTGGTSKILGSKLKEIISGDVEDSIDKILDSIAPEWSSTFTYGYDAYVIYEGELWRCFKDTGSTVGEFKTSEWIKAVTSGFITHVVNKIADRFVASNPPFMTYRYSVGDMVFYSEPYHDEQLYVCNTDLPQGESTFNPEHWDVVYTVAGLSKYLMDKIAEAGQIDDVQVKTTGDYESVVDENKVAKIDLSNMLIEKSVPNLPQPIASFSDGAEDLPLKSLTASIVPVQDLHGYDSPWVGGAGKNKLSVNNESFTRIEQISVENIPAGNYTFSAIITSTDTDENVCRLAFIDINDQEVSTIYLDRGTRQSAQVTFNDTIKGIYLYASTTYEKGTGDTATFKDMMIEEGSSATSYAPYSNICPISGWTEEVVTMTGKNLANLTYGAKVPSVTTGEMVSSYGWSSDFIKLDKNNSYVISSALQSRYLLFYDEDKNYLGYILSYTSSGYVLNTSQYWTNAKYVKLRSDVNSSTEMDVQLEVGTSATTFEPYSATTYTIPFTDGQGESVEVFGGSVDVDEGKVLVTHYRNKITSVTRSTSTTFYRNTTTAKGSQYGSRVKCDKFVSANSSSDVGVFVNSSGAVRFNTEKEYASASGFLADYGGEINVVYERETPYELTFNPTSIKSLDGENNVFASTGDVTKLEYIANATDVIANLEARVTALENQ